MISDRLNAEDDGVSSMESVQMENSWSISALHRIINHLNLTSPTIGGDFLISFMMDPMVIHTLINVILQSVNPYPVEPEDGNIWSIIFIFCCSGAISPFCCCLMGHLMQVELIYIHRSIMSLLKEYEHWFLHLCPIHEDVWVTVPTTDSSVHEGMSCCGRRGRLSQF